MGIESQVRFSANRTLGALNDVTTPDINFNPAVLKTNIPLISETIGMPTFTKNL